LPQVVIVVPTFRYQNRVAIDRALGFIRKWSATDTAAEKS
jgi:hypothetical protein